MEVVVFSESYKIDGLNFTLDKLGTSRFFQNWTVLFAKIHAKICVDWKFIAAVRFCILHFSLLWLMLAKVVSNTAMVRSWSLLGQFWPWFLATFCPKKKKLTLWYNASSGSPSGLQSWNHGWSDGFILQNLVNLFIHRMSDFGYNLKRKLAYYNFGTKIWQAFEVTYW